MSNVASHLSQVGQSVTTNQGISNEEAKQAQTNNYERENDKNR